MFCCISKNSVEENTKKDLLDISLHDTVPFIPPVTEGKVVKVYDGDTITIATALPYSTFYYRFHIRPAGIDSPEIKGKTEKEKTLAKKSKDELHNLIFNKQITLKNVSIEKYGRLLADVYLDNLNVNKWLLDNNLAVPYDGGNKADVRPKEWD